MEKTALLILVLNVFRLFANQTLINLPADSWYTASSTKMNTVCDPSDDAYQCSAVQATWSGGAFDPVNKQMIIWGGGHQDSPDNAVYAFSTETLNWRRLTNSTGSSASQDPLPNGDPASRHTYDGLAFLTQAGRLFAYGGSQAGNGYGTFVTWTLDVASKTWHNMSPGGPHGTSSCCDLSCEYDPISQKVYLRDPHTLYSYDYAANQWTILLNQDHGWNAGKGIVDTKRNLYFTMGSGEFLVWDIAGKKDVSSQWTTTGSSPIGSNYAAAGYDSKADKIVAWTGGAPYVLDLTTKVWTQKSGTNAPSSGLSDGTFGRFRYIPEDNVFILVNGVDQDVRFYKHTAGAGTAIDNAALKSTGMESILVSPNPFRALTSLKADANRVEIFDSRGQRVSVLKARLTGPGHEFIWNASTMAPGVYSARCSWKGKSVSALLMLMQ